MIEAVLGCLKPDGVLVINTVLLASLTAAVDCLSDSGWIVEVVQLQVSRAKEMPYGRRFNAQNPIWIIRAEKR